MFEYAEYLVTLSGCILLLGLDWRKRIVERRRMTRTPLRGILPKVNH